MSASPVDSVYYIKQQCFETYDLALKAFNNQYKLLKQLSLDYPSVCVYMGLSTHDSHNTLKIHEKTGRAGRRRVGFRRKNRWRKFEVTPHIHIYIAGYYAATVAHEFATIMTDRYYKSDRERFVKSHPFSSCKHGNNFIPYSYVERQSTNTRTIGNIDEHISKDKTHRVKLDLLIQGSQNEENPFDSSIGEQPLKYIFYYTAYGCTSMQKTIERLLASIKELIFKRTDIGKSAFSAPIFGTG